MLVRLGSARDSARRPPHGGRPRVAAELL